MATPAAAEGRPAEAAQVVRRVGLERSLHMISFLYAQEEVAEALGTTPATARKYLRAAVEEGLLTEITPHSDWSVAHAIPGSQNWIKSGMDVYADRGWSFRLVTYRPEGRMPVASSRFLAHADHLAEIGRIFQAEADAIAAKAKGA
ncbi:hypothetical protein ACWGQT_00720 [Streptomyces yangpuensis]